MTFQESIKTCFKKYAEFQGRASRSEFWWFVLFGTLVNLAFEVLDMATFDPYGTSLISVVGAVSIIVSLALLLPNLAVTARRLHDVDRSGWWMFLVLVPIVGFIVLLVWYCKRGTVGPNRFGSDPLADSVDSTSTISLEKA